MKIKEEVQDELNHIITIELDSEDYKDQVENKIKELKKTHVQQGFRHGSVPATIIKKQYGTNIVAEEVQKILQKALNNYIIEKKLIILGQPIPKSTSPNFNPFDYPSLIFQFDIGLSPEFTIQLDEYKLTEYTVNVDEELINNYIQDLTKRYGKIKEVEVATKDDLLVVDFYELATDNTIIENGIKTENSNIVIESLKDNAVINTIIGLKKEKQFDILPTKLSKDELDMAKMLNITKNKAEDLIKSKTKFRVIIKNIYNIDPAELNQDFYDKIFKKDNVKSEDELKDKVKQKLEQLFLQDTEYLIMRSAREEFISKLKLNLPNDFLKKWIKESNQKNKKITDEVIEKEYDQYVNDLRWELIKNKIAKMENIKVDKEEILEHTKNILKIQFAQYGQENIDDETLKNAAESALKKEKEARNIYESIYNDKIKNAVLNKTKIKNKKVSYEEFVEIATGKTSKRGILENIGNLFK